MASTKSPISEITNPLISVDKIKLGSEEISLIQDSTDDLQWCAEVDYQYKSYITPPSHDSSKYVNICNKLDANLAEIDIETFRSEDINAVFLQNTANDSLSLSRSIFDESVSLSSYQSLNSGEELSEDTNAINSENIDNTKLNGDKNYFNDISVDSLDSSLFEKNTSKLLQKCTIRDKKNYTIAFEGSITSSQELNGLHNDKVSDLNKSNFYENNENVKNMTKSSQLEDKLCNKSNRLVKGVIKLNAKLTQSIPDVKTLLKMNGEYRLPYCPVSGFIPLYDLQSSQSSNSHSSGSEFSPPRSLVKAFMQNRSPFSSQQISPSLSYESRSQESTAGNTPDASFRPIYYNILEMAREANNNIMLENKSKKSDTFGSYMTTNDDNIYKNTRFESQRMYTFPIKEVDENISDSFTTDINMKSVDINEINSNISDVNRNPLNLNPFLQSQPESQKNYSKTNPLTKASHNSDANYCTNPFISRSNQQNINQRYKQPIYATPSSRSANTQFVNQSSFTSDMTFQQNLNYVPNQTPLMTPESPNDSLKSVYVYYPNYSLPDLSFLEQILEEQSNIVPQKVYMSPTKHQMPARESVSVKMRQKTRPKGRPKSFNDFESLSKQNFNHIKDWDSLNILLPNEFKELFQKVNNISNTTNETNNESEVFESFQSNVTNGVRMRTHRSNGQLFNKNQSSNRKYIRNKRFSLQEYPFSAFCEPQPECHINDELNNTGIHNIPIGMPRSVTMPNCHNSCHCHQHCCHNCCHSCCRTPRQSPMTSADKPIVQTPYTDINTNSIDKLCQLLAMDLSFKKLMNIINGQNVSINKGSQSENCTQNTPQNAFNENIDNGYESTKTAKYNTDSNSFKELKQRWESLATITSDIKLKPNSSINGVINQESIASKVETKDSTSQVRSKQMSNKIAGKPEIARKPKLVLRRPQSSIPRPTTLNTENSTNSHYKSMIPVPKTGQTKSNRAIHTSRVKTQTGLKPVKP
ncbi:uncharacterized protein LOC128959933 isoform X2 [Oppia nitens]|uniref:uncharacterized protein LOC128959933 isoform X2 n=1 Tax=Oppia nitens TaxID=1686743 RepID=UPI0023DC0932|nr:uncharacterized protein LOC128959933 isoform X2 [Oppia nitens]